MAVAKNSSVYGRKRQRSASRPPVSVLNSGVIPLPVPTPGNPRPQAVGVMASSHPTPMWLLRLCIMQRYSSIVTFLVVAAALAVYGLTVYYQQLWSEAYRKLETLQRNERQLEATNEVLKSQMAQKAEKPNAGLVSPTPGTRIFLRPAPNSPTGTSGNATPSTTNSNAHHQQPNQSPLAY